LYASESLNPAYLNVVISVAILAQAISTLIYFIRAIRHQVLRQTINMKVNMLIVVAMAFANRARAACTVPDAFVNGFVSGGTAACTLKAALPDATPCTVAAETGYAVDAASTKYSCLTGTVTPPAAVITGCLANYYQESGATAADLKCTVCPAGKTIAAADVGSAVTVCDMCKANFFQASGTSKAAFTCTECTSGTIGSAVAGGAVTVCTAASSTTKVASVASTSPKTSLWGKHIVLGVVIFALAAYEF